MDYRVLGKTGLKVSCVGLGGIPLQRIDAAASRELLHYLCEQGVNYIDTARGYSVSEEYIGFGLEGMRDRFVLATKSMSRDYAGMQRDIETSLTNLRTTYIDLYQLHNLKTDADFQLAFSPDGAVAAIQDAIKIGKVGHLGATAHSLEAFEQLLEHPEIETIMFPYNLVEQQGVAMMKRAAERNVGFIAMKPLAGGNLENATLAMRFLMADPLCTIAIPGMATIAEAAQNLAAANDHTPLTAQELAEMTQIRETLGSNFCRRCGYCMPCTVKIDIPTMFLLANYVHRYGLGDWAKTRYEAQAAKAGDCIGCGQCEARCPYDLSIREKLGKVKEVFGC